MLLKRRRCSVLYNHWDVFLRYCFKILGLSNCVVCLQESSEQGWKKDRVLKRSEFTHIRFYIEINQKWSDFILVLFFLFNLSLFLHIWQILSSLYIISFQSRRFLFLILPDTCQWCFFSCFSSSFFLSLFAFSHYFCDISCRFPFFPQFLILFCSVFLYLWTVFIFLFFIFIFCIICSLSSFLPWLCNTVIVCRPCLLVMDSLKLSYHDNVCRLIREWVPPQDAQRTENKPNPHLSVMLYSFLMKYLILT